jgi:hypothetical protein
MVSVAYIFEQDADAKRPFPPLSPQQAQEQLRDILAQSPRLFAIELTRWTLAALLHICRAWVRVVTLVGLWKLLRRLGLRYKRGRLAVHSPDTSYARKRQGIAAIEAQVRADPQRFVLLYVDEFTYTRQPTLAKAYAPAGPCQVVARLGYRQNYEYRILAAVNALTGQVHYLLRNHIKVATLRDFWRQLHMAYPQAETIYVVLDNWPVHYHPDALVVLQPQPFAADFIVPPNWPTQARPSLVPDELPLVLVPLPTYASWLNPIEKLWRYLRQTVSHLHPFEDDSDALKAAVATFLDRFAAGSLPLLRYIGLLPY